MAEGGPDPAQGNELPARIERLIETVGEWTSWLTLIIVLVMAVNVLLRYFFSTGSVWAQELEWHLLVPLILFGMSYALRHGEHVRVDILYGRFTERNKARVDLLSALLTIVVSAIIIWLSLHYVEQAYVIDEGSSDPGGLPHRYLIKALIPVGFALLLLQSVAAAAACLGRLKSAR